MQVNPARIAQGIVNRERRFLSRAITLTESSLPEHAHVIGEVLRSARRLVQEREQLEQQQQQQQQQLLHGLNDNSSSTIPAVTKTVIHHRKPRIAITGPPGSGKSSLVEALGSNIVEKRGLSLGVLAVDPSDADRGGSILGDKTRMERLSHHPNAFVRPSPSRGHLGGVTVRCWEALEIFESANFDMTLVETVGVGQSEIEARHLTDLFVLLVPPLGGDDLQGVKRGIMHAADLIVVTKADQDSPAQMELAEQAASYYRRSASLLHTSPTNYVVPRSNKMNSQQDDDNPCLSHLGRSGPTEVMMVSSKTGLNIDALGDKIFDMFQKRLVSGAVQATRQEQRLRHFRAYFEQSIVERATQHLRESGMYEAFENQVMSHLATPREAGDLALEKVLLKKR